MPALSNKEREMKLNNRPGEHTLVAIKGFMVKYMNWANGQRSWFITLLGLFHIHLGWAGNTTPWTLHIEKEAKRLWVVTLRTGRRNIRNETMIYIRLGQEVLVFGKGKVTGKRIAWCVDVYSGHVFRLIVAWLLWRTGKRSLAEGSYNIVGKLSYTLAFSPGDDMWEGLYWGQHRITDHMH